MVDLEFREASRSFELARDCARYVAFRVAFRIETKNVDIEIFWELQGVIKCAWRGDTLQFEAVFMGSFYLFKVVRWTLRYKGDALEKWVSGEF